MMPAIGSGVTRGWRRLRRISPIWLATAILFAVSPLIANGSLGSSALRAMIPFAALLAIASIGQAMVMAQRELDLSVPGSVTLAAMVVTQYAHGHDSRIALGVVLALLACVAGGLVIAMAVTLLRLSVLVASLGANSIYLGASLYITHGVATGQTPHALSSFSLGSVAGVSHIALVALAFIAVGAFLFGRTIVGRRFGLVAESPVASQVAGIAVRRYLICTLVGASLCYGVTGVLLAGFLQTPGLSVGTPYLLSTVAAVVVGGVSDGRSANLVLSTTAGALFLTQLEQIVLGTSTSPSTQYFVEGAIIAAAMLAPRLRLPRWLRLPSKSADRSVSLKGASVS